MGCLVMILTYIINGKFSVLPHDIIFLVLLQLCLLLFFVLHSLFFQIKFYLIQSVYSLSLDFRLICLELCLVLQRCENVTFCLSRFSCLTDHSLWVAGRHVLFLSLDVWTLFSFSESNI